MSKKRNNPFRNVRMSAPEADSYAGMPDADAMFDLLPLGEFLVTLPENQRESVMEKIAELMRIGVTDEVYSAVYRVFCRPEEDSVAPKEKVTNAVSASDMKDKTLVLKIQMKDVTKPPMWREVEVSPAASFSVLHEIIQCVMGFAGYHLWQFGDKAYGGDILIKEENEEDDLWGRRDTAENANTTPLSDYLRKEGDKMEYIYDFGDDWIFTITVKKVLDRPCPAPVCLRYKGDMNAIEDIGGPWGYMSYRSVFEDWPEMSKKERKEAAEELYYESADDLHVHFLNSRFSLEDVNNMLSEMGGPDDL